MFKIKGHIAAPWDFPFSPWGEDNHKVISVPALAVLSQLLTRTLWALIYSGGVLQSARDAKQEHSDV